MKGRRWEVRLAGLGGQGLALAGLVLADAAVRDGKHTVMTHAYGAQQRGGPSEADVIISDEEIDYPRVTEADVLVLFGEEAFEKHHHRLPRKGLVVVDTSEMTRSLGENARALSVPFARISEEVTGSSVSGNMVALGFVAELTKLVSRRSLMRALRRMSHREGLAAMQAAVEKGIEVARSTRAGGVGTA